MKNQTLIIALVIALAGCALLVYALSGRAATEAGRTLNLAEYGVALEIPGSLAELTYTARDESANGPGAVLHMYTKSNCDLGALYQIKKKCHQAVENHLERTNARTVSVADR